MSGELFIGGDGLARGYWRRDELTAEKFIADPFSTEPGARLYRTGDLARWRRDGVIEFLGRADNQIKLRGYRIEPGEIETALKRQPDVLDSAVIVREDTPGDKRLVAYVVRKPNAPVELNQSALIAALKKSLPEYLVPSAIVALPALPRTPNGKLDRNALPAPYSTKPTDSFPAPQTPLEEKIAAIWTDVLGRGACRHDGELFRSGRSLAFRPAPRQPIARSAGRARSACDCFRGANHRADGEVFGRELSCCGRALGRKKHRRHWCRKRFRPCSIAASCFRRSGQPGVSPRAPPVT